MSVEFNDLTKLGDLLFCNGSILSHFQVNETDYFMFWVDQNTVSNKWLVFRTSKEQITRYLKEEISLRNILTENRNEVSNIIDLDNNINCIRNKEIINHQIPKKYLPGEKSFFSTIYCTDYALQLLKTLKWH